MPRTARSAFAAAFIRDSFSAAASRSAAADAAGAFLRRAPFGSDPAGRVLRLLSRWTARPPRRSSAAGRPKAVRVAARIGAALAFVHIAFILSTSLCLFLFKSTNPAATTLMAYRAKANGWTVAAPRFVPLEKIPKLTRTMTVRVEDGTFYEHHGIEPAAIRHAYELNKEIGTPLYGGSTITMQTARTIFLVPEKSYLRKYLELIVAFEMEAILGKDRILELYFNYAEWGKGIFGIESAARKNYKKGVASLSRDQAMRLVTLLSSPIRFTPYDFGRNGILHSRYAYLVKRWGDPPPAASGSIGG